MRRLILQVSVLSLDGFINEENSGTDALTDIDDTELEEWMVTPIRAAGTHIMGSTSYLSMAEYFPSREAHDVFAQPMNAIPKVVFSRSLTKAPWHDSRIASGDTLEEIDRLKKESGGDIVAHGGALFLQSLAKLNVVDEYRLVVYPFVVGRGTALFGAIGKPRGLNLVSAQFFSSGVGGLVYLSS
jgi:dihydrofolate reductase